MKYQVAKNEFLSLGRVKYDKKNDDHETKLLKVSPHAVSSASPISYLFSNNSFCSTALESAQARERA